MVIADTGRHQTKGGKHRWVRGLTPATLAQAPELETSLRYSVTLPLNKYNRKQEVYGMGCSTGVRSLHSHRWTRSYCDNRIQASF